MVLEHIHAYIKWAEKKGWYKCADPLCHSFIQRSLIKGKEVMCSHCFRNKLVLDNYNLRRSRPACMDCSNTKEAQLRRRAKETLQNILGDI